MGEVTTTAPRLDELVRAGLAATAVARWDLDEEYVSIFRSGKGCRLRDVDDREYIDFTACNGTTPLGYRDTTVDNAVVEQITQRGTLLPSSLTEARIALAAALKQHFPVAQRCAFFRTGSCGASAAVRIARVHTGRPVVLTAGYHGWHDWQTQPWMAGDTPAPRFPQPGDGWAYDFGFNLTVLRALLDRFADRVACVVVTPEPNYYPAEYFTELSALCRSAGVLLVLDEVMSGFRFPGGVHGHLGLDVDLVVVSKGLANGYGLSAVMGSAEVMATHEQTWLGGTYNREILPMVAALATMDTYTEIGLHDRLTTIGATVKDRLNTTFGELEVPARALGHPTYLDVVFDDAAVGGATFQSAFARGVYMEPSGTQLVGLALDDEAIDEGLDRFRRSLEEARSLGTPGEGLSDRTLARFAADSFGGDLNYMAATAARIDAAVSTVASMVWRFDDA